ncbi:MAG: xanthine dehydrogenase family protein molybdopterin-binding subunit, partial [Actinobacteria bacterium]|nr:xanthine dehydrogenase family protein molybdopterin-binding subunit [Actinomycetota bacterium]
MTATIETTGAVGRPIRRKEDERLLHGRTNWTDNIQLPGTLHMATLRSPMAHAKIAKIDITAALASEGVVHVYTGADFPDLPGTTCVWPVTDDIVMSHMPAICSDEVRYVGDVVAIVLATDQNLAVDALQLIDIDYIPLGAVVDMEEALKEGSPLVHESAGTNRCYTAKM